MKAIQFLSELSTDLLARYKKAAYADAKKADSEGDYERGNKRFKGINKATNKQFDNDLNKHQHTDEGMFDSKPKVDFKARAKELFASGLTEQQVLQQLIKEGCPPRQAAVFVQGAQLESISEWLAEEGKASRALCQGGKPDSQLGASQLASCKSQGLRARDGDKSHLIGKGGSKVRVTVGGKKIKGKKYGGPLPDYGTRKGQQ
jgi:hypothetical protein